MKPLELETQDDNPMLKTRIEKIVVNSSVGRSGEALQQAMTILEQLTGQKPCQRKAKKTIRDWGVHRNEPISCLVTLRGQAAYDFLKRTFETIGNRLFRSNFDYNGNFAFGIGKHIDLPGVKYDPKLGIIGMDVCVAISKPGYSVKKRRISKAKIGKKQKVTKEESIEYFKKVFGIDVLGE